MRRRREPRELDWQAELAARSAAAGSQLDVHTSRGEGVSARRVKSVLWRLVAPLGFASGLSIVIVRHDGAVSLALFVVFVGLAPFQIVAGRRARRAKENQLEPTEEQRVQWELGSVAHQLRLFLDRPPDRVTYERWLHTATTQLKRVSPEVARRWAQPDRGCDSLGETVTNTELASRRERLLQLYSAVAPPEKVELLTETLPQAPNVRAVTSSGAA
jgi:hypothetical protein